MKTVIAEEQKSYFEKLLQENSSGNNHENQKCREG